MNKLLKPLSRDEMISNYSIIISGLPLQISSADLFNMFIKYEPVCAQVHRLPTGLSRGFATITFRDDQSVKRVLRKNKMSYRGHKLGAIFCIKYNKSLQHLDEHLLTENIQSIPTAKLRMDISGMASKIMNSMDTASALKKTPSGSLQNDDEGENRLSLDEVSGSWPYREDNLVERRNDANGDAAGISYSSLGIKSCTEYENEDDQIPLGKEFEVKEFLCKTTAVVIKNYFQFCLDGSVII